LFQAFPVLFVVTDALCFPQVPGSNERLAVQAREEYATGKFAEAQCDVQELTKRDPSNVEAEMFLGRAAGKNRKLAHFGSASHSH
jgi:hypothetical protein